MAKSKRDRYNNLRKEINRLTDEGSISEDDNDSILEFLDAKDPECGLADDPNDTTKANGTLAKYAYNLKRIVDLSDFDLCETTSDEINIFLDGMRKGNVDGVKDEGLTKGSVNNYQKSLRKFYQYHTDLGVDSDDIILLKPEESTVDERDIFTKEDIQEIRDAATHPRDRCLVDLLLYTGQRLSAVLNLRLKDINLEEGTFYLNTDNGDMKGADGKRPLLYAEKATRDWMNSHPTKNDPESYLITQKIDDPKVEAGSRMDNSSIYNLLQNIGDKTSVNKPMNAHNFRHTFVTICKRNYEMDNDTIKRLIGHDMDSTVMETTYAHLTDDDVIDSAERAVGIKDEEPESPLTPDICDVCNEPIPIDDAKACPSCGMVFTPDAKAVEESIDTRLWKAKGNAMTESEHEIANAMKRFFKDNPEEIIQAVTESSEVDVESFIDTE